MTKECIWKIFDNNPDSTTGYDMRGRRRGQDQCETCSGWDETCPRRTDREELLLEELRREIQSLIR